MFFYCIKFHHDARKNGTFVWAPSNYFRYAICNAQTLSQYFLDGTFSSPLYLNNVHKKKWEKNWDNETDQERLRAGEGKKKGIETKGSREN